jgi:lipid-A-disaccharide synthase-like uncharacterized protein
MIWLALGFAGQALFTLRFVAQWVLTERERRSVVPVAFWYFSLAGGLILLVYAIHRLDPVFIAGQATGLVVYSRNLYFIRHNRARAAHGTAR